MSTPFEEYYDPDVLCGSKKIVWLSDIYGSYPDRMRLVDIFHYLALDLENYLQKVSDTVVVYLDLLLLELVSLHFQQRDVTHIQKYSFFLEVLHIALLTRHVSQDGHYNYLPLKSNVNIDEGLYIKPHLKLMKF
ncbi:hypothetical protein [Bartonella sp. DGB2]|uniref:hypothetical protein n=1 Tax=Bartonella sp. DGB2 TaxID=3388426 RepID=UPI00398FE3A7